MPSTMTYAAVDGSRLKVMDDSDDTTVTLAFDSKTVPVVGPTIIQGTMIAAKIVDDLRWSSRRAREGVQAAKSVRALSSDGKTMTVTTTVLGPNASGEPSVTIYVKQ